MAEKSWRFTSGGMAISAECGALSRVTKNSWTAKPWGAVRIRSFISSRVMVRPLSVWTRRAIRQSSAWKRSPTAAYQSSTRSGSSNSASSMVTASRKARAVSRSRAPASVCESIMAASTVCDAAFKREKAGFVPWQARTGARRRSDHAFVTKCRQGGVVQSEPLAQHGLGMLAQQGRAAVVDDGRIREPQRRGDRRQAALPGMGHRLLKATRLDMRVSEDAVNGVDRTAGHMALLQ